MTSIAKEFKNFPTLKEIHIEGHTDDSPISTDRFHSNWELSGARSSRIARLISEIGVKNPQIIAEGYGSSVPILPNRDDKGQPISKNQNVNRRVVFKLKFSTVEPPKIVKTKLAKYGPEFVNAKPQNSTNSEPEIKLPVNQDMEARFNEAQARLDLAQKKLKEIEEQKKKNKKIEEMERKIQQIENRAKDLSERAQKAVDEKK